MQHSQRAALVVEPAPLIAAAAAELLTELGFAQVELAASIAAALDLAGRHRFDFAMLSVVNHSGSIADVAHRLNQLSVPYVLVSDLADGRDRPPALQQDSFVTKPYGLADLVKALGEAAPSGALG